MTPSRRRQIAFIGAKGGVGATTITLGSAARIAQAGRPAVIADLTGGASILLGRDDDRLGISDTHQPAGPAIAEVLDDVAPRVQLLARGEQPLTADQAMWKATWRAAEMLDATVLIDAGSGPEAVERLRHSNATRILVTTLGYEALARSRRLYEACAGYVVVAEQQRALSVGDFVDQLGRCEGQIGVDPLVGSWADAGMTLAQPAAWMHDLDDVLGTVAAREQDPPAVTLL